MSDRKEESLLGWDQYKYIVSLFVAVLETVSEFLQDIVYDVEPQTKPRAAFFCLGKGLCIV